MSAPLVYLSYSGTRADGTAVSNEELVIPVSALVPVAAWLREWCQVRVNSGWTALTVRADRREVGGIDGDGRVWIDESHVFRPVVPESTGEVRQARPGQNGRGKPQRASAGAGTANNKKGPGRPHGRSHQSRT